YMGRRGRVPVSTGLPDGPNGRGRGPFPLGVSAGRLRLDRALDRDRAHGRELHRTRRTAGQGARPVEGRGRRARPGRPVGPNKPGAREKHAAFRRAPAPLSSTHPVRGTSAPGPWFEI